jgi:hypothetical protein
MAVAFSSGIAQHIIKITGAIVTDVAVVGSDLVVTFQAGELNAPGAGGKRDVERIRSLLGRYYGQRYDRIRIK